MGEVLTVGDGIAVIVGLKEVEYGEIVLFECGVKGMVQDIRTNGTTGVVLFGDASEITEGQVFHGVVATIKDYGAFVDIGDGMSGLVHISQISHDFLCMSTKINTSILKSMKI